MKVPFDLCTPQRPFLLLGRPGIGKTAKAVAWAQSQGREAIVEATTTMQSADLRGLPVPAPDADRARWLPLGTLQRATEPDCSATVVLDDVGQSTPAVQAALMHLIYARRLGDHAIAPGVTFILTANRAEDQSAARPLLAALRDRCMVFTLGEDDAEIDELAEYYLSRPDVDPLAAGYVRFRRWEAFAKHVPEDTTASYTTPRGLEDAARMTLAGVTDLRVLSARIGRAGAADYLAYREAAFGLPPIDEILRLPNVLQKIKDPGLLHAVVVQAAAKCRTHTKELFALADYLKGGWGTALVSSACTVFPELKSEALFKQWASAHKELL